MSSPIFSPDTSCPGCGRSQNARIWPAGRQLAGRSVVWCGHCGFGWLNPQPTKASIEDYYKNLPPYILQGTREKEMGFRNRIRQLRRFAPQRGQLLDVGAGIGIFMKMAREDGWHVFGIDPQRSAAEIARRHFKVDIEVGALDTVLFESRNFDAITLWDVLEHVHDPGILLAQCKKMLKPGGLLCLSIPNASGICARLFKGHWRYVMGTHLNYFTTTYAESMLRRSGFLVFHRSTAFKVQSIIQGLINGLNLSLNSECLFRSGRENSLEKDRPEQTTNSPTRNNRGIRSCVLQRLRYGALQLNSLPFSNQHGDILDLYGRLQT